MTNRYLSNRVTLGDNQNVKLEKAFQDKSPITLRFSKGELTDNDELMLTKTQLKKMQKAMASGVGVDIKISKTQIRHVMKHGGSLFSTLVSPGIRLLPVVAKKVLPALATGAIGSLGGLVMDKITKRGRGQIVGYTIPRYKIAGILP